MVFEGAEADTVDVLANAGRHVRDWPGSPSTIHAGTEVDLSVAWSLGALRLTVRDHSPELSTSAVLPWFT